MSEYQGRCHCGAVQFSFTAESIDRGLRCNCSICKRKGAMMSNFVIPPEHFHLHSGQEMLGLYQFGSKVARHYFCRQCGIYPFHETARFPGHYRVNLGCVDAVDTFALEYELFDGAHLL